MLPAPFVVTPVLTAIAVGYRNNKLIADDVLPRVPVGAQSFKYQSYPVAESFTVPNTRVGRRSPPTNVEFTGTEVSASTDDYGLDDSIPAADEAQAAAMRTMGVSAYDPVARATQGITDLVMLDRELRVAALMQTLSNFDSDKRITLSGTSQFSDYTNSDPIGVINNGMDSTLVYRPNVHAMGRAAWTKIRSHPHLVNAVKGGTYGRGAISRQDYCDLFEIEELLIGEGFVNTAKRGQAASMTRVWGKHITMYYRDKNATTDKGLTFGLTAEWGARLAGSVFDPDIGLRGGTKVRVGEAVKRGVGAHKDGVWKV